MTPSMHGRLNNFNAMSDSNPSKRQRISRACDQCRRRKSKCDGLQPVCAICRVARRNCTYQNSSRRRGLQSGYVKSLESILGVVLQHIPNSENNIMALLRDAEPHGNFLSSESAHRSVTVWRSSMLCRNIALGLEPGSRDSFREDSQSDDDPERELDAVNPPAVSRIPSNTLSANEGAERPHSVPEKKPNDVLNWALPANVVDLVEFYFTHIHCWFPILERHDILRTVHSAPPSAKDPSAGNRLILWAIISYVSIIRDGINSENHGALVQIHTFLQYQLLGGPDTVQLSHIQALLVLVLLDVGNRHLSNAWVRVGQATRILSVLPISSRGSRYRPTLHGCVFLDTMISALLEKTPCLSWEAQGEHGDISEDGLEEWDMWTIFRCDQKKGQQLVQRGPLRALSAFNMNNQLMQRLTRILHCQPARDGIGSHIADLRQWKSLLANRYPSPSTHSTNPAILTLYLTLDFVTFSLIRKCVTLDSAMTVMVRDTLRSTLDLLDDYIEITGSPKSSPLLPWFLFQAKHSFHLAVLGDGDPGQVGMESRLERLRRVLNWANLPGFGGQSSNSFVLLGGQGLGTETLSSFQPQISNCINGQPHQEPMVSAPSNLVLPATLTGCSDSMIISSPIPHQQPLGDTRAVTLVPSISTTRRTPGHLDDIGSFDSLFEEVVGSITPTGHEPTFAHNLGFCAGDIDTDFMDLLRQSN